jgi:hypothetical protein
MISQDLSLRKESELLSFLYENNDVFAWRINDHTGGEQRHNRAQAIGQHLRKTKEAKASQNVK